MEKLLTQFSPPYRVQKSAGYWYVVNRHGGFEVACDCRFQAEDFANEMNLVRASKDLAKLTEAQSGGKS